jgi:rRNA-processing protein FCF1
MKPALFVLDTHVLVWFVKGKTRLIGLQALFVLSYPRARIVIPTYVFQEVQRKFGPSMDGKNGSMRLPPSALLRLVCRCSNIRVLSADPQFIACEFRLKRDIRSNRIPDQDIPIAAALMTSRDVYDGPVALISNDGPLVKWAMSAGIPTIWSQANPKLLPA